MAHGALPKLLALLNAEGEVGDEPGLRPCLEDHPRTCKWLGSPPFRSHEKAIWRRGPTTRSLGDLETMVINHLLTGMILQVEGCFIP